MQFLINFIKNLISTKNGIKNAHNNHLTDPNSPNSNRIDASESDPLALIHKKMQGLKYNALHFGDEIDLHNEILDDINHIVNKSDATVKPLDKRINKLLQNGKIF